MELKVTDNNGATVTDTMQLTVQATVNTAANIPPVANAGSDQTITLPTNTVLLNGNGADADGTVVGYVWRKIAGPTSYTIVDSSSAVTSVTGLVEGIYIFELQVTDNNGATATSTVKIIVKADFNITALANA